MQVQLGIAKDVMDRKDAKQLAIVEILLQDQLIQIDNLKVDELNINKHLVKAAINGAPLSLIEEARASGDPATAASILSEFLAEPVEAPEVIKVGDQTFQFNPATGGFDTEIGTTPTTNPAKIEALEETITNQDYVLTSEDISAAVGPNMFARMSLFGWKDLTGKTQSYIAAVEQLTSTLTMDTLINLKERGGTLGALSDREALMLSSAATKIGTWRIMNKKDKVTGYNINEKSFIKEVTTLQRLTNTALDRARGTSVEETDSDNGEVTEGWYED